MARVNGTLAEDNTVSRLGKVSSPGAGRGHAFPFFFFSQRKSPSSQCHIGWHQNHVEVLFRHD